MRKVYAACLHINLKKLFLPLHSYELIVLLWAAIAAFALGAFWQAVAIGFTQHLLLDQLANPISRSGYFLTFRALKRFNTAKILKEGTV